MEVEGGVVQFVEELLRIDDGDKLHRDEDYVELTTSLGNVIRYTPVKLCPTCGQEMEYAVHVNRMKLI